MLESFSICMLAADELAADATEHASVHHDVPGWVTCLFLTILIAMVGSLALEEKIHAKKSMIVGTFAGISLLLATLLDLLSFGKVVLPGSYDLKKHLVYDDACLLDLPVYIPQIDWGVITIILGASLFVEVTSRSGVFSWMAIRLTKASGGDPWRLMIAYGVMTVVFSAMLNNVTAMIIIGSLTAVSLNKLQRKDLLLGFLLIEGLLTNVGGLLTLISSVPNIIVGKAAGISFVKFFLVAAPYVVVTTAVTLVFGKWRFGIKGLKTEEDRQMARELVASFDENDGVPSDRFFWFSVGALVTFILCLSFQSALPCDLDKLGMGFIALLFAGVVLMAYKSEADKFYALVDWDLLAFFASLFVVIHIMEHAQVLNLIGGGIAAVLNMPIKLASGILLAASAVASSVTDNIPLAAVLAKILQANPVVQLTDPDPTASSFWWCVIFGANLGGNITPIGSASTVVAMTVIHRYKLPLTFIGFVKTAAPFAAIQIILAIIYVVAFL